MSDEQQEIGATTTEAEIPIQASAAAPSAAPPPDADLDVEVCHDPVPEDQYGPNTPSKRAPSSGIWQNIKRIKHTLKARIVEAEKTAEADRLALLSTKADLRMVQHLFGELLAVNAGANEVVKELDAWMTLPGWEVKKKNSDVKILQTTRTH